MPFILVQSTGHCGNLRKVEGKRGCKALGGSAKKILDIEYHIVVSSPVNRNTKGGDVVEMDMQDSADMCSCMKNFSKLLRKWRWKGRADLGRL